MASASKDGHRVILAVLGAADRYAEARALLDFYYQRYQWRSLDLPATRFSVLPPTADGRARYLTTDGKGQGFLPRWEWPWLRETVLWNADGTAERARFTSAGRILSDVPLKAKVIP